MTTQRKTGPTSDGGARTSSVRLKTARKRTISSQRWLMRQLNDPYVHQAKALGYRSRAAFKLLELNDKKTFLKPGLIVVDLGAAPGGWTQVAAHLIKASDPAARGPKGRVFGIDLLEIDPLDGATLMVGNFLDDAIRAAFRAQIPDGADVVLSDMAASTTGNSRTDHLRTVALAEAALLFAVQVLKPGGTFVAKVFQGGADHELLTLLRKHFTHIRHVKPPASRKESPEMYVIAAGFRL